MADGGNLYSALASALEATADQPAFELDDGRTVSCAAFLADVGRMANALGALGVGRGDRVMVQVDKSLANVHLYLATLKAGAVFCPLNPAYTTAELEYFIGDAEPRLLAVSGDRLGPIEPVAAAKGVHALVTLEPDGSGSLADLQKSRGVAHETVARAAGDLAALLYTSGTTGRSKGAMLTQGNLESNARVLSAYWGLERGDVLLHALPIFHTHGLFVALNTAFVSGSRIIWLPRFDADAVMRRMPRATVMMGVPTFFTRLLGTAAFGPEHCRNMRLVISGSAPLLAETHQAFARRTGHIILERYGMTETGMITSNPHRGGARVAGTVGYALPGVSVRIADGDGKALPAGEVGVLEVKGPNVFKGYWRNPEKTREEFRADGYFVSGDLATMAADGRVTIVGRAKDLIISGGFNVYPKEVEDEINALPGIAESAVIGVPHPDFGEGVIAAVTAVPGADAPDESEILGRLAERLAKFKLPKRVFVVGELPRNAMGKVQKTDLRAQFAQIFST